MKPSQPAIVCFRADLRLRDNPALRAAAARRAPIIPVFIHAPHEEEPWAPGAASRWWLHQSLKMLDASLRVRGLRLVLRRGDTIAELLDLCRRAGAEVIFWNRRHAPAANERDRIVRGALGAQGIRVEEFEAALLHPIERLRNKQGGPYKVFTPFWRALTALEEPAAPQAAPRSLSAPGRWPRGLPLAALDLEPRPDWAGGLRESWQPGEAEAQERLRIFLRRDIGAYATERDRPDHDGVSRLSPHLHFGELSARQIWHAARRAHVRAEGPARAGAEAFLRQLAWREFAHHLLHHFPFTADEAWDARYDRFPWRRDPASLRAWRRGRTGIPIVDAGMRQLWRTGWMHNRVRMVVGSLLVKHLLLPWQEGACWFWDTLVDADLANNSLGWQWIAGCGADAAPYFRVFNPVTQGRRFDPEGLYVRLWVPELSQLPSRWIHEPWAAPPAVLDQARVRPGDNYPRPIVDLGEGRKRALRAYDEFRRGRMKWAAPSADGD